jgi:hypothetical protein
MNATQDTCEVCTTTEPACRHQPAHRWGEGLLQNTGSTDNLRSECLDCGCARVEVSHVNIRKASSDTTYYYVQATWGKVGGKVKPLWQGREIAGIVE